MNTGFSFAVSHSMERITIINSGGGVAKTTTALNLAASLAKSGSRVLAIDLDGQGTSSDWLSGPAGDQQQLLLDVILGEVSAKDAAQNTYISNLDLIPASFHLYQAEKHLAEEIGADSLLKIALDGVEDEYDYAVIDTPPQLGILSYNAMIASPSGLIVPCEASYKSLKAMKALMRVINLMKARRCSEIEMLGILASRVDARTKSSVQTVDILRDAFGGLVFDSIINEAVAMKDAPSHHKAVMDYLPKSKSAKQVTAFSEEVIQRIQCRGVRNAAA